VKDLSSRVRRALRRFWKERSGKGSQSGAHLHSFAVLLRALLIEAGIPRSAIHHVERLELPGHYRPTKQWDLLVIENGNLLAAVELKAQCGAYSKNANNRVEEAVGSGTDLKLAIKERRVPARRKPWIGYLFLLLEEAKSTRGTRTPTAHFPVDPVLLSAPYARRYEELCRRLVKDKVYSGACFILFKRPTRRTTLYSEPSDLTFSRFAEALVSHVKKVRSRR
jgi:restriction endonuclease XhoI-like protein